LNYTESHETYLYWDASNEFSSAEYVKFTSSSSARVQIWSRGWTYFK